MGEKQSNKFHNRCRMWLRREKGWFCAFNLIFHHLPAAPISSAAVAESGGGSLAAARLGAWRLDSSAVLKRAFCGENKIQWCRVSFFFNTRYFFKASNAGLSWRHRVFQLYLLFLKPCGWNDLISRKGKSVSSAERRTEGAQRIGKTHTSRKL